MTKITKTFKETRALRVAREFRFDVENNKGDVREFILETYFSDDDLCGYDSDETWYWKIDNRLVEIDIKEEEKIEEWLGEDMGWEDLQDQLNDEII